MSLLKSFLDYWHKPPHSADADPVQALYHVYRATEADLDDLKSQGRLYIVPGKDSQGRWMPVFDEGKTDVIATLSSDIDTTNKKLKAICNDIEEVCTLAGAPTMLNLQSEHEQLIKRVKFAENNAATLAKRAYAGHGRTKTPPRPEEIAALPEVQEAYAKADALRAELTPQIEALWGKLEKIRSITEKYQG